MAYHFKHGQYISAKGVENCNKVANALALSAESISVSDSSLASGQITFLLFPSFISTMIKATSPTVIHYTSSSHLPCSQIQKTHSRHGRVLSATNHIHTHYLKPISQYTTMNNRCHKLESQITKPLPRLQLEHHTSR